MELETQTMLSFGLGLLGGFLLFCLVALVFLRRSRARFQAEAAELELTIADLRQERVDDRETNRRLRHELAVSTPEHLEATRIERDEAQAEVATLHDQLAERDRSLREARLAIQDIRHLLEAGDIAVVERLNEANGAHERVDDTGERVDDTAGPAEEPARPAEDTVDPAEDAVEVAESMDDELAEMTADERVSDG